MEFPYNEMVIEWNGSRVHISEFESKHPQLEPKRFMAEPQGLRNARPDRVEPAVARLLGPNPFQITQWIYNCNCNRTKSRKIYK